MPPRAVRYETPPLAGESAIRQPLTGRIPRRSYQAEPELPLQPTRPSPPAQSFAALFSSATPSSRFVNVPKLANAIPSRPPHPKQATAVAHGPFRLPKKSEYRGKTLEEVPVEYVTYLQDRRHTKFASHSDLHAALDEYYRQHPQRLPPVPDSAVSEASWPSEGSSWHAAMPSRAQDDMHPHFRNLLDQYHEHEQRLDANIAHLRTGIAQGNVFQMTQAQQLEDKQTLAFQAIVGAQQQQARLLNDVDSLNRDGFKLLHEEIGALSEELGDEFRSKAETSDTLLRTQVRDTRNSFRIGLDQSVNRINEHTDTLIAASNRSQARRFTDLENRLDTSGHSGTSLQQTREYFDNCFQQLFEGFNRANSEQSNQFSSRLTEFEGTMNVRLNTLSDDIISGVRGSFNRSQQRIDELETQLRDQTASLAAKENELLESRQLLLDACANASNLALTHTSLQGRVSALEHERDTISNERDVLIREHDTQLQLQRTRAADIHKLYEQSNMQLQQSQARFADQNLRLRTAQNDLAATQLALAAEQESSDSMEHINKNRIADIQAKVKRLEEQIKAESHRQNDSASTDDQLLQLMKGLSLNSADAWHAADRVLEVGTELEKKTEMLRHAEQVRNAFADEVDRLDAGVEDVSRLVANTIRKQEEDGTAGDEQERKWALLRDTLEAVRVAGAPLASTSSENGDATLSGM